MEFENGIAIYLCAVHRWRSEQGDRREKFLTFLPDL